ncbi:DUF938 domain-containing protein [Thiolapillus sp.]|uniref:DUF938 domain-containing protein n=5 Tax=Thiolapillus sp. TaxID=2017437 RepID=UPI0025E8BB12|nr:DUF938 domain-containing protein [Thiolapillus sp.]
MKPYAESCDQNRDPILEQLRPLLVAASTVLEIGSGTGQHAVYFSTHLPHLHWQPSDRGENLPGIRLWCAEAGLANLKAPLELDVTRQPWPAIETDAVFSANTAHIMAWPQVEAMMEGIGKLLPDGGVFLLYGPFNYNGRYTSDSNRRFDGWLKARDPLSGVRDFESLDELAGQVGMHLQDDIAMPANNRILCWRKSG